MRCRARDGVYDIVVYQDAILLSRVAGTDPAMVGALLGALLASVVGALVGAVIGERIARVGASKRLQELFYAPPEHVFGTDRRNRFIRSGDVRVAQFWEFGPRQRVLVLSLRDGSTRRLKFDARFQSNSFAPETLRVSLEPVMETYRRRYRPATLVVGALVVLAALAIAVIGVAMLVGSGV